MPFVAMPKKHRLYGPFIGTTLDIVPQLNIPSLGICTVTRMPCVPVLPQWEKYHDGALWIEKFRPLLVTSVCRCKCGGTIRIFDTRKSAQAAASAPGASEILSIVVDGLKKRIDREIGSSLMIPPFGSILKELPYAGEVVESLGRGVRKGAADTLTGLYEMITDPLGTLGGIATLAGIAAVGYGKYMSLPNILMPAPEGYKTPEERLAKFDETFGTNLTDAHEGIKSAVDEKITEFDQADGLGKAEMTAEATGYVMVMIVDAVYGSKCTSKLSKAAKMSKLGRAARASKVGQSIAKLTNKAETLAELLKTAAKNKAKTLWNKLPKPRKGIFWVMRHKPKGMSIQDYLKYLKKSVHNPDSETMMLGKFKEPPISYIEAAKQMDPPARYFDMGDDWNKVEKMYGLDDDAMFDYFNKPALDDAIKDGKTFQFSHDPKKYGTANGKRSSLGKEYDYIEATGKYKYDEATMTFKPLE